MSVKGEQLSSLSIKTVDTKSFHELKHLHIPLENLLLMLMNLVQIRRGHKSGLEIIKVVAPNLVNVSNTCHQIHNIVKTFT